MLRKPSLSLKKVVKSKRLMKAIKGHQRPSKAIKGHQRPQSKKSEKSHFINHCLIYAQEAFHQHENSSKAQKTDKGHQRPQSKKVKKSHFINHNFLTYTRIVESGYLSFIYAKKVFFQPQKIIKGQLRPKRPKAKNSKSSHFMNSFA